MFPCMQHTLVLTKSSIINNLKQGFWSVKIKFDFFNFVNESAGQWLQAGDSLLFAPLND